MCDKQVVLWINLAFVFIAMVLLSNSYILWNQTNHKGLSVINGFLGIFTVYGVIDTFNRLQDSPQDKRDWLSWSDI